MEYRTFPAPIELADHVRFLWTLDGGEENDAPHRLTAETCPNLILITQGRFAMADGTAVPAAHLAGAITSAVDNVAHGPYRILGVYLWPWSVTTLFGLPPGARFNTFGGLAPLLPGIEALLEGSDEAARMDRLITLLIARAAHAPAPDPLIAAAVRAIVDDRTGHNVAELVERSGLARRQFERRFKACTGLSPALFLRIQRFQRTYRMLENGEAGSLTGVAHACGWFDQSHFIRDFKRFSGLDPRTYFKRIAQKVDNFVRLPDA